MPHPTNRCSRKGKQTRISDRQSSWAGSTRIPHTHSQATLHDLEKMICVSPAGRARRQGPWCCPHPGRSPNLKTSRARVRVLKALGQEEPGGGIACTSLLTCSARLQEVPGRTPGTWGSTARRLARPTGRGLGTRAQDTLKHGASQQVLARQHRCSECGVLAGQPLWR